MDVLEWLAKRKERKLMSMLEEHLNYLLKANRTLEAVLAGEDRLPELRAYEHEADGVRKQIALELAKSELERVDKLAFSSLTKHIDRVIDHTYAVGKLAEMIRPSGRVLSQAKNMQAKAAETISVLSNCIRAFSIGKRADALRLADSVEKFEEDMDDLYASARRMVLELKSMATPELLMTYELFSELENISDSCEHACDDIRLLLVK